ncbi:MAG: helix-turn-helix domain-containing protein [Candidatus Dadabacteria bacterium]|nr:helix-turn-helix domain-containing protein [Candidatus Dadabacteria bacterium]
MRLANPKKGNTCYPSIKTICKNCKIIGESTVRLAIHELDKAGLITKKTIGRGNVYTIEEVVYLVLKKTNRKDKDPSELEATPPACNGIESSGNDNLPIPPAYNGTPPQCDAKHRQHTTTNNNKSIKTTNNTKEEEEEETNSTKRDSGVRAENLLGTNGMGKTKETTSARGKAILLAEANRYYQSLTAEDRRAFDIEALKLLRPDESNSMTAKRNLRRRYFQELLEVHTVRREDEPVFEIPAEKPASEHMGVAH